MEVREITEEDLKEFREVSSQVIDISFPEYPPEVRDFFKGIDFENSYLKKKIKDWDYEVLLAVDKGKIVGFLVMEKMHGGVSFCDLMAVIKEYRRRGMGIFLVRSWEERIRKKGGHKLMLLNHSPENRKFYKKCGFKEEGFEEKLWYGVDYWVHGKIIGKPNPRVFLQS